MKVQLAKSNGKPLDIALILTVFNPLDSIITYEYCSELIAHFQHKGMRCAGIIVNNQSNKQIAMRRLEKWWAIPGSNSLGEFSGYQEGLEWLVERASFTRESKILFANDTLASHRNFHRGSTHIIAQSILQQTGGILGFVESNDWKGFSVGEVVFDKWVSTFLFSIALDDLIKLDFIIRDPIVGKLFSVDDSRVIFSPAVSIALQNHIISWLTTPGKWYGAKPYQEWNKTLLQLKIACILSEKILSAKCFAQQIEINELPCNLFFYERN